MIPDYRVESIHRFNDLPRLHSMRTSIAFHVFPRSHSIERISIIRGMLHSPPRAWLSAILAVAAIVGLIGGCASGVTQRERMQSANAFDRADAAVQSAKAGDKLAVHTLVGLLEDRDGGVRLYAINALERLCGTTMGYRHYAGEPEREEAVRRWRDALREGKVVVVPEKQVRGGKEIATDRNGGQNVADTSRGPEQGSGK